MSDRKLPTWYPTSVNHIIDFEKNPTPYSDPSPEILAVVKRRLEKTSAKIIDIAGGYGRYAIPLALEGHNVTIVDIDPPHLDAANRNIAKLPKKAGKVTTVFADVTKDEDIRPLDHDYDASLNLAFLYLAPPQIAKEIFKRYSPLHKRGGLAVVQFFTNITRRDLEGGNLAGEDEYAYTNTEGRKVLTEMFEEGGFRDLEIETYEIHDDYPYYLDTEVLVASGLKTF